MEKYIIGLDSGTSGIKAVLFNTRGEEIMKQGFPLTAVCEQENWFEEDFNEIWEKTVCSIQAITKKFGGASITGIGITAQGDGAWLIDEKGEPVRRGCCFCDGRGHEEFEQWSADGTARTVFEQSGTRIFTGNQPCVIKWLDRQEPESLKNAKYIMHLKDALFYRLTGQATTDVTDQSLIFLNMETGAYSRELFEAYGLLKYMEKYPEVKPCIDNYARIRKDMASLLGLNEEVIVSGGPMDVAACAIGAGVLETGECCSIMGTAALHEMVVSEPCRDSVYAGMTVFHGCSQKWLRLMASLAGTPNLEWFLGLFGSQFETEAQELGLSLYEYAQQLAGSVPIGSAGVIYHPYLLAGGERAPFTNPDARASFTGLSVRNTKADLLRAVYEGVAYAMRDCYDHMPGEIKKITVCGGGAASDMWCQMFADVLGKKVVTVQGGELGAKGAALTNMVIQGVYSSLKEAALCTVHENKSYMPDSKRHVEYEKYFELYQATYRGLEKSWKLRWKQTCDKKDCMLE